VHIVGTAGHVDHGKSTLIAALTGTNPDRLIEEQQRGMTLDLGFAHLRYEDGVEGGIVDVPGHERFLHNMLAGAAGMELLLLVVDANEGVMPQTLEHLQILQFLNVRRVLVVATKIDLVEASERERAYQRIRDRLGGTIAAGAPLFAVSAATGEQTDALRRAIHDELAALPLRPLNAPAYLPIDRAFPLTGLGTIVTGTLMQGSITAGERLVLEPGGKPANVRSIRVFETTRTRVEAGSRVALNLPGIDRAELARGHAIVGPELAAVANFGVRFTPLEAALPFLRRRTPVRAYVGSAEILGTLVLHETLDGVREMSAELRLREPVVAFPTLRFVVRRPSPMTLLGGGYVEGLVLEATSAPGRNADEEAVLAVLREKMLAPVEPSAIASAANLREPSAREAADALVERGEAIRVTRPPAYLDAVAGDAFFERLRATLEEAHREEPWAMGVTSVALARALAVPEPTLVRVAEHFVESGRIANRAGYYAALEHRPSLTPKQSAFFEYLVPVDDARPLLPIPFAGAAAAVKQSNVAGLSKAFDTLLARGAFVKVGDDLYRAAQIAQLQTRLEAHFRQSERMTASEFRDMLGTSRKYAVPLLEWLDSHGVTIRDGDYRVLRKNKVRA
jgi:selenocysteine-specific elongation factor